MQRRKRRLIEEEDSDEAEEFITAVKTRAYIGGRGRDQLGSLSSQASPQDKLPASAQPWIASSFPGSKFPKVPEAKWRPTEGRGLSLDEVPTFFPDQEEFEDPLKYIETLRVAVDPVGLCRIVPPRSWRPVCRFKHDLVAQKVEFPTRAQLLHMLQNEWKGNCVDFNQGPRVSLLAFKEFADNFKKLYFQGSTLSSELIEAEFWRIVQHPTDDVEVLSGAGLQESGFNTDDSSSWNLNNIPRHPRSLLSFETADVPGITVPCLDVGMCLSSVGWHVEDHFLYSVNYLHFGESKIWYAVPKTATSKMEEIVKKSGFCPSILRGEGVPVFKTVQRAGDLIVTLPRTCYSCLDTGYNCAETVKFAPVDWLQHGQVAVDLYQKQCRRALISYDKLLLAAARHFLGKDNAFKDQHLKMFLTAFKGRVQTEETRRSWLGQRIETRKMDILGKECVYCHYDLYLSSGTCECRSDKFFCLEHMRRLCKCPNEKKLAFYRYEMSELYDLLKQLEAALKPEKASSSTSGPLQEARSQAQEPRTSRVRSKSPEATVGSSVEQTVTRKSSMEANNSPPSNVVVLSDSDDECEAPSAENVDGFQAQILHIGTSTTWCSRETILPAGFKSRVVYYNYLDLPRTTNYISEIIDLNYGGPYFKVSLEGRPSEFFVSESIHSCWQAVQARLNYEIYCKQKAGVAGLPPVVPVEEVDGVTMFGLSSPLLKKKLEELDPKHKCFEYWGAKAGGAAEVSNKVLSSLLKKGSKDELLELYKVMTEDWGAEKWKQAVGMLSSELG